MTIAEPALGALLALGAAFTWAATSLLVRTLTPPFTPVGLNAVRTLAGGLLLWAWVLGRGRAAAIEGLFLLVGGRAEAAAPSSARGAGVAGALLAAVAWGVSSVLLKAPLREVDPVTAQAIRLPIAGLLLGATPWARGLTDALRRAPAGALARLAALSALTALSSVMFVAGLKYAGVAVATVLASTAPLFAIPLGLLFLGERLTRPALAGALVTVAGIVVLQL